MLLVLAGWGTVAVLLDVSLSLLAVFVYVAMTYRPLLVSNAQGRDQHVRKQGVICMHMVRCACKPKLACLLYIWVCCID